MSTEKAIATWTRLEGSSYPLGLSYDEKDDVFNFAIYSRHATAVSLSIYSREDLIKPIFKYNLDFQINKSNRIWHCRIKAADIPGGMYYAYKIDGPEAQNQYEWHAFDKDKVLLDPYAKAVSFPFGFKKSAACIPGPNDSKAPLGVILKEQAFDWQNDKFVHHFNDLIIYELHVRGFTKHPSSGLDSERGCFSGIVKKIPYLTELGITAVELMPVQQFDIHNSYWGYNTLNFFSAHNGYGYSALPGAEISEFKTMVRELHKAGIEVIIDVVYNHTAEDNHLGPVYSFKGIDNSTYYLIGGDLQNEPYLNYSGTGNTLHTRNSAVRRLILDSLHYWRTEMHVDGFRFDLASVFNRNTDGSIGFEEPAILGMIGSDPDLAGARFIAEPWDATGAFYLGKKFPGVQWMQWNSAFRDDIRHFVKSDAGFVWQAMNRIYGSADIFPDDLLNAFHAYQSINYINSHDGFTLYDLVSYNHKHNEANGEGNRDGATWESSWNCGTEGDEEINDNVLRLRKKQAKNFITLLFLSNGTPMFSAGDEFLRTQMGNNNPYNQDNTISWIDWSLKEKNKEFFNFFCNMIKFRKAHPSLSRSRFWRNDIQWFGVHVIEADVSLNSHAFAFHLKGRSECDEDIYVMINAYWEALNFSFQEVGPWFRIINTGLPGPGDFIEDSQDIIYSGNYQVDARSICVFTKPAATPDFLYA